MIMRKVKRTTKGELNKLIDDLIHPYFKEYPALIIVDSLLHAMVEQDPDMSLRKFVKYNIPTLLESLTRKQKNPSRTYQRHNSKRS